MLWLISILDMDYVFLSIICKIPWEMKISNAKYTVTWSIFHNSCIYRPTPHFCLWILCTMLNPPCHRYDSLHNSIFFKWNVKHKISKAEMIYFHLTVSVDHQLQVWDLQPTSICKVPFKYVISSGVSRWLVQNWLGDV